MAIATAILLTPAASWAQQECKIIADKDQRLACFDRTVKAPDSNPAASPTRPRLIGQLDHWLLENGVSLSVFEKDKFEATDGVWLRKNSPLPSLYFFGFLDRAGVYAIATKSDLFRRSRESGFKSIVFFDKGQNGVWYFNIAKPGKVCSRDLCFGG